MAPDMIDDCCANKNVRRTRRWLLAVLVVAVALAAAFGSRSGEKASDAEGGGHRAAVAR